MLRAEGSKKAKQLEAEGEAQAILLRAKAQAEATTLLASVLNSADAEKAAQLQVWYHLYVCVKYACVCDTT